MCFNAFFSNVVQKHWNKNWNNAPNKTERKMEYISVIKSETEIADNLGIFG
jgi:hypothetical protein